MERLAPHIILRRGLIAGIRYPRFAEDISDYLARSLFFTSDLAVPSEEKKRRIAVFCGNAELCKATEEVIFTDPYQVHARNRWTSPQLNGIAAAFRTDAPLKLAIARLKLKSLASAEALIHGDLHTGSIVVMADDTRVIDHEFAFYGPMRFDIGAVIGNLLLNVFSQDGHAKAEHPHDAYQAWVLETVEALWSRFAETFLALCERHPTGDAYPAPLSADPAAQDALTEERRAYLQRLFADTLGFAAAKIIRRILGLSHNIDLEWIEDPDRRAACETRCLRLARDLMVNIGHYRCIADVTAAARDLKSTT